MDPKKATAIITKNVHSILTKPLNDEGLYDLSSIKKSIENLSNVWINEILPNFTLVSSEIIDYDPTFQSTYQKLVEMVKAGQTTDLMHQLLAILITTFEEKYSAASNIEVATRKFADDFNVQYERIAANMNRLDQNRTELVKEIMDLENKLNKPFEAIFNIGELIGKIEELKKKANLLSEVGNQLGVLQKATADIAQAAVAVSDRWAALNAVMNKDIDRLKQISTGQPGIVIEVELQAINKDWEVIMQQAKALSPANI